MVFLKFLKFHRKAPVLELLLNHVGGLQVNTFFEGYLQTTACTFAPNKYIQVLLLNKQFAFIQIVDSVSEAYSEPCQTSKMKLFAKIINS